MEIIFHFHANKTHFQKKRLCTQPHFESEGFWNSEVAYFIPFYYCHQVPTQRHSGSQRAPRPCCFCFRVLSVLHQSPARHLSIFQIHATRCARHSMLHSAEDCCLTFSGDLCFALECLWNVLARLKRKGAFKNDLKCWSSFIQHKLNGFD